jgi:hypothetical protein
MLSRKDICKIELLARSYFVDWLRVGAGGIIVLCQKPLGDPSARVFEVFLKVSQSVSKMRKKEEKK